MNYYARYFDSEGVFASSEELLNFLSSIPTINMTADLASAIQQFCSDNTTYPRHFRLPNKTTFIVIKTNSLTLEEFKSRGANGGQFVTADGAEVVREAPQNTTPYDEIAPGRYEVNMNFRRAYVNPDTRKCLYTEDSITVSMLGQSQRQCYDELLAYMKTRTDIDPRSQYPSIRSNNFTATLQQA